MRWTSVVCLCVLAAHLASSFPLEDSQSNKLETISTLEDSLGKPTSEHSDREKRTIGFLRTLFPGISKIIDDKIQQLTSVIFRVVGRFVLRGGGLGGGGGGGNSDNSGGGGDGGGRRVSITLPTYPPDEDEDEENETSAPETSSVDPSTESNDVVQEKEKEGESSRRRREAPTDLETAESEKKEERVPIVPDNENKVSDNDDDNDDIDGAESENEEISDAGESAGESTTRNKRLGVLSSLFGGGGARDSGSSSGSGSGGGSGNFLFDIIRKSADGAARAAGTVYRMIAGTETQTAAPSSDESTESPEFERLELETAAATAPTVRTPAANPKTPLVAGSGATEQQDENANAPVAPGSDGGAAAPSDDGYQAGIPGPITRLFVIANRGIANLIQDLILRLAQTSERIVNFKARLITAII